MIPAVALASLVAGCDGAEPSADGGLDGSGPSATDCTTAADGTECGSGTICVGGACVQAGCGDGFVDTSAGEQCEDGNATAFDGCEPNTCRFTCDSDDQCVDPNPCNGAESCGAAHLCVPGTPLAEGSECSTDAIADGVCRGTGAAAQCADRGCGNGVVDSGEDCDDMNTVSGDGCENDCTYTCTTDEDCAARETNVCDGPDTCVVADHVCVPTTPLDCDDSIACTDDSCDPATGCVHTDNGTGTFWYADCDRDGYAAGELGALQSCLIPREAPAVCGAGGTWTSRRPITGQIDCLDTNANVHPGVTTFHQTAIPGVPANVDFDYDCDGVEQAKSHLLTPCVEGDFHYDTTSATCGQASGTRKWVCPTSTIAGHWERFRTGEDTRVPCR